MVLLAGLTGTAIHSCLSSTEEAAGRYSHTAALPDKNTGVGRAGYCTNADNP